MASSKRLLVSFKLLFLFYLLTATKAENELISGDNTKECNSLVVCKLDGGPLGLPGPKGVSGTQGYPGQKGDKGDSGPLGPPGSPGPVGVSGLQGYSGQKGDKGDSGPLGPPGSPGSEGLPGLQGYRGQKGDKGDSGQPGIPGICTPCVGGGSPAPDPVVDEELYGTEEQPAYGLCYDVNEHKSPKDDKEWVVGLESDPIHVNCNVTQSTTCVTGLKLEYVTFGNEETKPFWLSNKGLKMNKATNLKMMQLQWLQERSSLVYQTIRYHCRNTKPFYRDDLEKSILLLTWNNVVIGPEPSLSTPLFYVVPEETDNCSRASKNEWSYTDIIIKTDFVQRLPVVDFLIRNVMNETQEVQIESVEMCFK